MSTRVDARRRDVAFSVLGGPTTVVDLGGRRFLIDPTFDEPGPHDYLKKIVGPAVPSDALGPVDVVLISHDNHPDNFDDEGRRVALAAPLVLTNPGAAGRLGRVAVGLTPFETYELPAEGAVKAISVQAVPAVHGPADGVRDAAGHVNCEVTGFVLSGEGLPTVYLSGDNASVAAVREIAERVGHVDVAVIFAGAARVASKERGRPLTLTGQRAAAAAEVLGARLVIPAHVDGWAHFSEGVGEVGVAFDEAGLLDRLAVAPYGEWIVPPWL
ncbi:MBL fold metallo-hydrolase [Mycobacterium paraterrae]|uniref:MBL fold metallo-hydrolase n=1 Tax=Mycobacterium paraterrae TaxID=577492 RepID=A0ABY3VHB8_9MYCO|nr:MBL fold metallo-hydrolase [Mycobacterium paraterrae]UMB68814.1 MBL fold metallo-hydrolase [Mycobacterium paraterrae]